MAEVLSSSVLLMSENSEDRMLLRAQLDLMGLWGRIVEVENLTIAREITSNQQPELCVWRIPDDTYNHEVFLELKTQLGQHVIIIGNKQYASLFSNEHFLTVPHTFRSLQEKVRVTILHQHISNVLLSGTKQTSEDQERLYRDLFDRGSDANLLLDYDTHIIIDANQRALDMYEITWDEIIGMNMLELVDDSEHFNMWRDTQFLQQSNGEPVFVERLDKKKNGTLMHVTVSGSLIEFAGRMIFQDIIRDETERKLAEEQRIELMVEQERVKTLSQFINDATHDFMTPLSIIKTSLYLAANSRDEENRNSKMEIIGSQVKRLQYMVENMMTVAKLDVMTSEDLTMERVNFNNMILTQVKDYQPNVQKHGGTLTTHLPSVDTSISIDVEYIKLAVENLLANALYYISEDGHIDVSVDVDDTFLYLSVTDDGIGIEEADLPHIFKRFYCAEQHRPNDTGSGLGLTIVKSIVKLHHGQVEVVSKKGVGSTFRILLPKTN